MFNYKTFIHLLFTQINNGSSNDKSYIIRTLYFELK